MNPTQLKRLVTTPAAAAAFLLFAGPAFNIEGAVIQATYEIAASDFQDSNGGSPPPPTSNVVEGVYTFTFDTDLPTQSEITPDQVVGLDITDQNGSVMDYDETNSGVNTSLNVFLETGRITIGGKQNTVAFMVGISDDFRVIFDISLTDFQVTSVFENLTFVTQVDPFYTATTTSVELLNATVIPEPASLSLLAAAGLGLLLPRRHDRAGSGTCPIGRDPRAPT